VRISPLCWRGRIVGPTTWGMFQPKGKLQQAIVKVYNPIDAWLSFSIKYLGHA